MARLGRNEHDMKIAKRTEWAANRFFDAAMAKYRPDGKRDRNSEDAHNLILHAFNAYALEWPGKDIRGWIGPMNLLNEGLNFLGNSAAAILLRNAVGLLQ